MFAFIESKKYCVHWNLFGGLFKYGVLVFFAGFYGGTVRAIKRGLQHKPIAYPLLTSDLNPQNYLKLYIILKVYPTFP